MPKQNHKVELSIETHFPETFPNDGEVGQFDNFLINE